MIQPVIKSFRDKETERVFARQFSRRFPSTLHRIAWRKLALLDAADHLDDLRIPPGNRLERLTGDREGEYSIRINDRWRITHNEFEHYTFGKMNDSLGRGAKTIRTDFPDVFELLLGLAGTLIVYNASGTKELRRIPHVMFLPFVRRRLNKILERTAITAAAMEEEEEEDDNL